MKKKKKGKHNMKHSFKRALMYVICFALIFANCGISGGDVKADVSSLTTTENLITNGYFEDGLTDWNVYFNESNSGSATLNENYYMEYKINFFLNWYDQNGKDNGPVTWAILLENKSIQVEAGKTYKICFKAKSTVKRPILLEFGGGGSKKYYSFALDNEMKEYTFEFVSGWNETINMKFHLGPMAEDYADNTTGIGITNDNFENHTINIGAISMVDITEGDVVFVKTPGIIGVESGATYKTPVTPNVNYEGAYNYNLTRDGENVEYSIGNTIVDDGKYVLTVSDAQNSAISSQCEFTVAKDIDYTKTYYTIVSKATDKVIEAVGTKAGNAIVQKSFEGSMGQFFTLEKQNGDYYTIKSLMSGLVIAVGDNDKLIQTDFTKNYKQQWKIINVPQGFVKFQNGSYSGKVIDIPGGNKTDNLQLQIYANNGSGDEGQSSTDAQRFDLVEIKNIKDYIEGKNIDVSTFDSWQNNAFITPIANDLNPAGPIAVEWYQAPGEPIEYKIYFDGELKKIVMATDDDTLKVEDTDIYTTKVDLHTLKIVAVYGDESTVETKTNEFYVTKKGIGWGTLHRTTDMNLSWYYRWSTDPAIGTDETLTFVPMLWGNYGDEWLANPENQKYGTVLSFNEPDWSDQSNVPVTKELAQAWVDRYNAANGTNNEPPKSVEEAWQSFMDSGLRIGSPATALAPPYCLGQITMNAIDGPDRWWADFEQLMDDNADKGWDYDFVAIHSYNGAGDPKSFIQMVKETYELTGKPIWITEFGVADWGSARWNSNVKGSNEQVIKFMEEVLPELDKLEYVERYAWFPFDPKDLYGGSSGLFDYDTGKLNTLGMVYAMSGLPNGYKPSVDYTKAISDAKNESKEDETTKQNVEQNTTKLPEKHNVTVNNQQNTNHTDSKVSKPSRVKIKKIKCKKKAVIITVKKQKNVKGYQVVWSAKKNFKKFNKKTFANKTVLTIKKFKKYKSGKKIYFKVRAFKVVNGKKYFGKYSKIKKVVIK